MQVKMNVSQRINLSFSSLRRNYFEKTLRKLWPTLLRNNEFGGKYEVSFSKINFSNSKREVKNFTSAQPTPTSHPHILKNGELTGGINKKEYLDRRIKLMNLIRKQENDGLAKHQIVILPGSPRRFMIDKIPYRFRQDTDMLYLSGCLEPECVLVIHSLPNSPENHKALIFTPPHDPSRELWDGPHTLPSGASHVWGVCEGLPSTEFSSYLTSIRKDLASPNIWYHSEAPPNPEMHHLIKKWLQLSRKGHLQSPKHLIHALRVVKSPAEIKVMQETCKISAESIKATIQNCKVPTSEHQLFAMVEYQCRMRGAEHLAYPPVVAGGQRANTIHYIHNDNVIFPGEMVLMDAGSEYRAYAGDVTRTWPVSGEFTPGQRDLYEAVLEVQRYIISSCFNRPSLNQLFTLMSSKLGAVLQELCILPKYLSDVQISRAAYSFCPHHVSHYLGMDVHDSYLVPKCDPIAVGSIITVEPGLYISAQNREVDPRYLGLGIRLEDDILITEEGAKVLTDACPKHPDDIENLVGADWK